MSTKNLFLDGNEIFKRNEREFFFNPHDERRNLLTMQAKISLRRFTDVFYSD